MTQQSRQIFGTALLLGLCLTASPLHAQIVAPPTADENRDSNLNAYVELMRSDIRSQKVALITQVMEFTEAEDATFWPIYRDYEAKLAKINNDRLALTMDYASEYEKLTDAEADRLVKGALDVQARRNTLLSEYYGQLKAALPAKTAARVIQVEHQILLLLDLQIAAALPIVN